MDHEHANDVVGIREVAEGIRVITLNRPGRLNAITPELVEGLHRALDAVDADPACRVVLLTGAGRGFCAGADLRAAWDCALGSEVHPPVEASYANQQRWSALVARMRSMPVVCIAAVNGPAAGGGFALALAADLRVASCRDLPRGQRQAGALRR